MTQHPTTDPVYLSTGKTHVSRYHLHLSFPRYQQYTLFITCSTPIATCLVVVLPPRSTAFSRDRCRPYGISACSTPPNRVRSGLCAGNKTTGIVLPPPLFRKGVSLRLSIALLSSLSGTRGRRLPPISLRHLHRHSRAVFHVGYWLRTANCLARIDHLLSATPYRQSPHRAPSHRSSASRGSTTSKDTIRQNPTISGMMNADRGRNRRERTYVGSECAVCEEPLEHTLRGERILQFQCSHVSHEACFYEFIREFDSQYCPSCNAPLHLDTTRGGNVLDIGRSKLTVFQLRCFLSSTNGQQRKNHQSCAFGLRC